MLNLIPSNVFFVLLKTFFFLLKTDRPFFAAKFLPFLRIKRCHFLKLFANSLTFSTIFRCVLQIIFCYAKTFFSTVAPENIFVQTCFSRNIQHSFCKKYPALCFVRGYFLFFPIFTLSAICPDLPLSFPNSGGVLPTFCRSFSRGSER